MPHFAQLLTHTTVPFTNFTDYQAVSPNYNIFYFIL